MKLYYTGASPDNLRKARQHAPSHTHGYGWTPQKMTPHPGPYFVDNGAYTESFDAGAWLDALEKAKTEMPDWPNFIVLPDVYGDAEATRERHSEWMCGRPLLPRRTDWTHYAVLQPGLPVDDQLDYAAYTIRVDGVFVGGPQRWQRAHGDEIVAGADERGLKTHVGNPGGADGLVWAYRTGFDSADTTTVFQNGYWHYLEKLERATEETHSYTGEPDAATRQATLTDGGRE